MLALWVDGKAPDSVFQKQQNRIVDTISGQRLC
jgi:hypothetical protein